MKKKIFLLYPYYWPLYKAGGPVQSIYNLAATLKDHYDFYFVSLKKDIDGQEVEQALQVDKWSEGPNSEKIYCTSFLSPFLIFRLIREVQPSVLLINGIFNWHTTLFGLLAGKILKHTIVISPRGMLQTWALKRNYFKKNFFLGILRLLLGDREVWHATDEQERKDICKVFGAAQQIHVASNIPRPLGQPNGVPFPDKSNKINLVFLSLINSNKNLHLVIDEVNKRNGKFILDIYGPIIDTGYWLMCKSKISDSTWISYKGAIRPWEVTQALATYHFFVLPTLGENFGHAIFDALSVGVPVIITKNTPWKEIDIQNAGFYIDLNDPKSMNSIFNTIESLLAEQYEATRKSSYKFAVNYLAKRDFLKEYDFLNR